MRTVTEPIVVGVDGSEASLRAVDWAADEAVLRGTPLRLVHASLWERYEGTGLAHDLHKPSEESTADDIVDTAARRARQRHPAVTVSTEVLVEEPEYALVRESREAALLVTGTRGRSGLAEALLGSVSLTVAGHAHCPMVVVRGSHDNQAATPVHGRVVVGDLHRSWPVHRLAGRRAHRHARIRDHGTGLHEVADRNRNA